MNILVVGAGAIGGYYGARLLQAGGDITFLVRPRRAAALASKGLRVHSDLGAFEGPVKAVLREELTLKYDLILLSCKAYDLEASLDDIMPAVGSHTAILPFLNGMSVYDQLDARFGRDRVLGGVAYIAVTLDPLGEIHHMGNADVVVVGSRSQASIPSAESFHALISTSAGSRVLSKDVSHALWNKWVMLASGALMTCLMRGNLREILATRDGQSLMKQAMLESQSVASAEGQALWPEEVQRLEERLLDPKSAWAASMMRDIAQNAMRLEAQAIVGDLIDRAERHGLDLPLTRAAYCHLQVYERQQLSKRD